MSNISSTLISSQSLWASAILATKTLKYLASLLAAFYRLDSITIIADNHRLNSLALEFIDLDIGDLLSEGCYNSHSGIVV